MTTALLITICIGWMAAQFVVAVFIGRMIRGQED